MKTGDEGHVVIGPWLHGVLLDHKAQLPSRTLCGTRSARC